CARYSGAAAYYFDSW
nr:immunoglobulin heavy chain junction region [Macaca mulatta]MOW81057.1 immunoglobulin heavy chain junction region [Macaca mulatta]MOW82001.1 immunoglobulin heavy chain junction region [Macaca mulatta]MOW82323.1 immunoglobulin heavy chain junction region [Macaca mulatta]MOW85206.1 immunoglobulin heavy chain junction region [Macaca mulatta]